MGRGSGRSSGSRGSASRPSAKPTQTASGSTRPSQRPQTAVQPHSQQPNAAQRPAQQQAPQQQHAPAQAPPQAGGGPGLLGTIGSVVRFLLFSMNSQVQAAGSFIGNVLADKFRGNDAPGLTFFFLSSNFFSAEAAPAAAGGMPAYDQVQQHPCAQFRFNFDSCVAQNQANIASCQWTWDSYKECMNANSTFVL